MLDSVSSCANNLSSLRHKNIEVLAKTSIFCERKQQRSLYGWDQERIAPKHFWEKNKEKL